MAEFSPADAALEGFRFTREHPAGLVIWGVLFVIASFASAWLMIRTGAAAAAAEFGELAQTPTPDPAVSAAALQRFAPGLLLSILPIMLVQVFAQAGILRAALRPSEPRAYLGFGGDELRMFGAVLILMLLTMLAGMAVTVAGTLLAAVNIALGLMILFFGTIAVVVFIGVRLCLLYPIAVAERSLNVGEAWRMTGGRFWRVFGALFLALVFFFIVLVLGSVVSYAVRVLSGVDMEALRTSTSSLLHPGEIAATIIESLLQAMGLVLTTVPAAAIYKALKGGAAEVF